MSSKVKRKVTVENSKEGDEQPRRPSVFERLGSSAVNVTAQPSDRHSRTDQNEKCRNWLRSGTCMYGNTCRFKHDPFPASSRRASKPEKDMDEKDLRHRVRTKRDEPKGSRTGSLSPKRTGKRSSSRSRKGEHESKIKSTVVVTRPRSPTAPTAEPTESKKKAEGTWEDDLDDNWLMDAAQLDFKEELTLERKRQQLQRELALELQKELNENVTITKTVSFSESSSSSSSTSGSVSSSSGSSSSSSDDDTDDSSSSSSSSSSSGSRPPAKKRGKKSTKGVEKSHEGKGKDDYDKIKSSRAKSQKMRSPSPILEGRVSKKNKDKRKESSPSPKRRHQDTRNVGDVRSNVNVRTRGPRTPSPVTSRKQRQWAQSSSTDSRSADVQKNLGKRHKKKRDASRGDKYKSDRGPTPPPLSSPNRTALMPTGTSSKKSKQRDASSGKSRHRGRDSSPLMLARNSAANPASVKLLGNSQRYIPEEKVSDKHRGDDRSKFYAKDGDDMLQGHKRTDSRDRGSKRSKLSPRKDNRRGSLSPMKDRYDSEMLPGMKKLYPQIGHKDDRVDHRRQASDSPVRSNRRKMVSEIDKKRDIRDVSPRMHDSRRDNQYRATDLHYDKRNDQKSKRLLSPEPKKSRDDRSRDYQKDRNADYESAAWSTDHRKATSSTGRRTPEPRGRQEMRSQPSSTQGDRSRDRDQDRKKRKERDLSARSEDSERNRLPSPRRSQSPLHSHHAVREIEPLTGNRGHLYDTDVPPVEREYAYGYDPLHDPYNERLLPPDYESDVLRAPIYAADVYPESRYRRDGKEPALIDRYGPRDVLSPREILPHRDIISLTGRNDDYIPDLPMEERGYEERWSRGRGRDDWDAYGSIPPAPLPPHVAAALDEDRYGMPRRRRASPDWQRVRMDDRDSSMGGHRQMGRGQLPPDGRSRSPAKGSSSSRGAWGDRGGRHDRSDSRHEDSQKNQDDRKGRNSRKDRGKRKEDLPATDSKPPSLPKEKAVKRPHSISPPKDVKRRREDTSTPDNSILSEKAMMYKRLNDEVKGENKSAVARTKKSSKLDTSSPRSEGSHSSLLPEKLDVPKPSEGKNKEDRKSKHESMRNEDDFSDWSDGDDDLLNRDDFVDSEGTNDNSRTRHKSGEKSQDDSASLVSRRKEKSMKDQQSGKKAKESRSRTSSRDRSNEETSHPKDKPVVESKDTDAPETSSLKDDTATDVDEYITAESVDYDPISDDELDALIEEPVQKPQTEAEKSKIVDALDVDWSALMNETNPDFKPGCARRRFKAAHVLSRIGFSQVFAGPELSEKLVNYCQKQLDEESAVNDAGNSEQSEEKEKKKFAMEHQIAAFHVAISQEKKDRANVFNQVGPYRRALCARRDLQIRNLLCKPVNKLSPAAAVSYSPQYSVVDKDLYKQSLEFLKKKSLDIQPQAVDVC